MISRFTRYPGGRVLGFGSAMRIQKRNLWSSNDMAISLGLGAGCMVIGSTLATYLTYKSYKYLRDNYEIVRKDKSVDENLSLNDRNSSEENQCAKRF